MVINPAVGGHYFMPRLQIHYTLASSKLCCSVASHLVLYLWW